MIETLTEPERAVGTGRSETRLSEWKAELRDDLDEAFATGSGRWSRAVAAVGWIHLAAFLACQAIYDPTRHRDPRHLIIWAAEFVAVLMALRLIAGRGWMRSSTAVGLVVRFWGTFLILSFNVVTLNELMGWEMRWYRPAWGTISSFFLASMAWLFTPRMFIPAVQMYFTALLMIQFRDQDNLIYGVSWWLALLGIAARIRRRERAGADLNLADPDAA